MYISIDPGKRTGVATFNLKGEDVKRETMEEEKFLSFLVLILSLRSDPSIKITWIMEDFKLRQDKALDQTGSDMPAPRIIGAVQMVDRILGNKSRIVYQSPGNLRTALKWAGFPQLANKPKTWHCPDDIAAYAHGKFYLIKQNILEHPIFSRG